MRASTGCISQQMTPAPGTSNVTGSASYPSSPKSSVSHKFSMDLRVLPDNLPGAKAGPETKK